MKAAIRLSERLKKLLADHAHQERKIRLLDKRKLVVRLKGGCAYFAVSCHACGAPIPFGRVKRHPAKMKQYAPNTRLQIACVNADCGREDIYEPNEIVSFLWPESRLA
jgi:hypothetical protein